MKIFPPSKRLLDFTESQIDPWPLFPHPTYRLQQLLWSQAAQLHTHNPSFFYCMEHTCDNKEHGSDQFIHFNHLVNVMLEDGNIYNPPLPLSLGI